MANHRLPDVLVTNRSGVALMVSVFFASLCSFGVLRACELQEEASQRDRLPMVVSPANAQVPGAARAP
jgi:hypothetical protein